MKTLKTSPDLKSSMESCHVVKVDNMFYDKWWISKLHGFWAKSELYVFQTKHFQDESYNETIFETFLHEKWKSLFHQKNVAAQAHRALWETLVQNLLCYSLI